MFSDDESNFAGIRVVRNTSAYPTSYIDGEILEDNFISKIFDEDVIEGQIYYYTVYTYNDDYHFSEGTEMKKTSTGWWMDHDDWVSTKGIYAKEVGLHIHFDDQLEYLTYFPDTCKTMLVRDGFEDVMSLIIDMCTN